MAETTEKREERNAPFTDGDYIPRNEAPKMPRVFSNADLTESREPERRMMPVSLAVIFCVLFLFLGLWLGSGRGRDDTAPAVLSTENPGEESTAMFAVRSFEPAANDVREDRPGLGVAVQTVSPAAAEYYGIYCDDTAVIGAQIYAVGEDSAAQTAGLLPGDILVALDGAAVRSAGELSAAESRYQPGESAVCTVFRDGELLELSVVFDQRQTGSDDLDW